MADVIDFAKERKAREPRAGIGTEAVNGEVVLWLDTECVFQDEETNRSYVVLSPTSATKLSQFLTESAKEAADQGG